MTRTMAAAALALVFSPLPAAAQEYAVKIKQPGLGDKSQVKVQGNTDIQFKIVDDAGNAVMEAKENKTRKLSFSETGLERAPMGDQLVRIKRHYDHAERRVKGVRETLPYQGKNVLIEKKDGAFQFQIEDDERLEGKDAEELHEEFNKGGLRKMVTDAFLPRKAVKLNEAWTFDWGMPARGRDGDGKIEVDDAKSRGSGKLTKAYQKDGKQFGVIELTLEFPLTMFIGDDGTKHTVKNSKIVIELE